jgi:hypothetical protein
VAAFSRTRTFHGRGHVQLPARLQKSQGVILPRRLVKVCREKPARFIWQESVYADGYLAQKVVLDDGVGQRKELPGLLVDFLSILPAAFVDGLPVLYDHRHISVSAISILPSPSVDIFSPAKHASKQRDPLSGALLLVHRWRRLDGFGWRILCRRLRYRNAVNCQKPPQASILLAETNIFLLRRFEWKRV